MKIFVSASYSSQVNYDTGEVFYEYKEWLESYLKCIEGFGHTVFCALRFDDYKLSCGDPAEAFSLDEREIDSSDFLIALITDEISAGVQTEIGMAIAKGKRVFIAHLAKHSLGYFNQAIILAGQARELILPETGLLGFDPFVNS